VQPKTLEEKILACIDSASHMTDSMYLNILKEGRIDYCKGKLERDFRDIALIPQVQKKLSSIYLAWKELIREYKKLEIVDKNPN